MQILLFPFGSAGDVHPFVGLGLALRQRGHRITLVTSGYFRDLVERVGLDYVEQGSREQFLLQASHPDLWHPTRSFAHLFRNAILKVMRPQYELIAERAAAGPVLAIGNCLGFGVRIAAQKLGVPLVTVHCQPSVMWSDHEPPTLPGTPSYAPRWMKRLLYWIGETFIIDRITRPETNAFRAELGLPPMRKTTRWWHSPDANLGMFPAWYAAPQPDWPPHVTLCGFPLWDEGGVQAEQPDLDDFLRTGTPPIVFAPGSANMQADSFFREAAEACRLLGRRGVLLTRFTDQVPRDLPAGVRHFDYVPFSRILPRAAALVHHGGIGTAAQALRAGIPHLVMPLAHDQPDNASRLKRLGVGDWLAPRAFRGSAVAARLERLLGSADVSRACAEIAQRFVGVQPFETACAVVERLAERRSLKEHPAA